MPYINIEILRELQAVAKTSESMIIEELRANLVQILARTYEKGADKRSQSAAV
jgi:hypothetical protein